MSQGVCAAVSRHLRSWPLAGALVALLGLAPPAGARDLAFDHLAVEDGLSDMLVSAILKDSRGFLWVGTKNGLDRYDGQRIVLYDEGRGYAGRRVNSLHEDRQQRLWVGGTDALYRFDRDLDRFVRVPLPDAPDGEQVRDIAEDAQGNLWLATPAQGVVRFDPDEGTIRRYRFRAGDSASLSSDAIRSVAADGAGNVWVGTRDAGLNRLDAASGAVQRIPFTAGDEPGIIGGPDAYEVAIGQEGEVWVSSTEGGLSRLDPVSGRVRRSLPDPGRAGAIGTRRVRLTLPDGKGRLYVGTENGGLEILDLKTGRFARHLPRRGDERSLTSSSIYALLLDDQEILWVGTYNGGMCFTSPAIQRFALLGAKLENELSDPHVAALFEDRAGDIWVGTDGGGLNRISKGTRRITQYRHDPLRPGSIGSDAILTVREDTRGELWVGGWDAGLNLLDRASGQFAHFVVGNGSRYDSIYDVLELPSGDLLLATYGGPALFRRASRVLVPLEEELPSLEAPGTFYGTSPDRNAYVLAYGPRGDVWVAHTRGVTRIDLRSGEAADMGTFPNDPEGITRGDGRALFVDSRRNLWIGTDEGLNCLPAGVGPVRRFGIDDGLPGAAIKAIQEDEAGNLWVSTNRGLCRIEAGVTLPASLDVLRFDVSDGLQGNEFAFDASLRTRAGELFFGGQNGLTHFYPRDVVPNPTPPPVVLTGLRLFNKPMAPGEDGSPLVKALAETRAITLAHDQNVVTFEFAALNYILPQKNRYRYKLEPLETEWNDVGRKSFADYTPPPGEYVFRVKAANNDGVWDEDGIALQLTVTPPWYLRGWFFAIALAGVGLVAGGVYRLRVRAIETRRRELEAIVEQRTAELAQSAESLRAQSDALARENEERRRAEEDAGRERDLLHTLMDNIPDLIYFKDRQGRFTRINRAHARAVGLDDPGDAIGQSDADFFGADFARTAGVDEGRLFESGQQVLDKLEHDTRGNRWYLATKVPIRDDQGTVTGLVGISKDITERRHAEEKLARDLERFLAFISEVGQGDLTRRAREGDDTLGKIAWATNEMVEGFARILTEVRDAAFSVSTSSSEIMAAANQIARGSQFGSDQVHDTSSVVEEMVASMGQVAKSAEESAHAAQQVLQHLLASDRAVDASGQGMAQIDAAVSETADKMRLLSRRSREVFEIIDLIEEIASRSELLSINAAIEAAHAGEAGQGFGVVADEIRNLAERSKQATRSVTTIVQGMSEETTAVLAAMETSMREVKHGLDLSDQARNGLREISSLVRHAAELAEQICQAVREQAGANQTLATAMQNLANITEESSASSRETARAVSDLAHLAERLAETIARFKIDSPETMSAERGGDGEPAALVRELSERLAHLVSKLEGEDGSKDAGRRVSDQRLHDLTRDVSGLVARLGPGELGGESAARRHHK